MTSKVGKCLHERSSVGFPTIDRLAPSEKKELDQIPVEPVGADVAYGAFWYPTGTDKERCFRFILRIGRHEATRPDISRLVHPDYSKWD